jgi:hypothetical protein
MRSGIFLLIIILFIHPLKAQENKQAEMKKNLIKLNLLSLPFSTVSLQYERLFTKHTSLALGMYVIPSRGLPNIITSQDSSGILESMVISGYSFTPEFRIYPGKKERHPIPRGFYFAPYYRNTVLTITADFSYTDDASVTRTYAITGSYISWSAGILLGMQWLVAKRLSLDLWILGGHYGSSNAHGELTGDLTIVDQDDFKRDLENARPPSGSITAEVNDHGAAIDAIGPFGGFRFGLVMGFAF